MTRALPPPEFSRPVVIDRLPDSGQHERLTATPDECAALATRFDILEVRWLKAHAVLMRTDRSRGVALEVTFEEHDALAGAEVPDAAEGIHSAGGSQRSVVLERDAVNLFAVAFL